MKETKIICDRCNHCETTQSGIITKCWAFIDRKTRFINGITKDYINKRMIGDKDHCKEYKKIR